MEILLGCYGYKTTEIQQYLMHMLRRMQHVRHSVGVDVTQYVAVYAAQAVWMMDKWVWMTPDGYETVV